MGYEEFEEWLIEKTLWWCIYKSDAAEKDIETVRKILFGELRTNIINLGIDWKYADDMMAIHSDDGNGFVNAKDLLREIRELLYL